MVKNLSYMTHVTIPSNSQSLYDYVTPPSLSFDMSPEGLHGGIKVFINGCWLGNAKNAGELYRSLKHKSNGNYKHLYVNHI